MLVGTFQPGEGLIRFCENRWVVCSSSYQWTNDGQISQSLSDVKYERWERHEAVRTPPCALVTSWGAQPRIRVKQTCAVRTAGVETWPTSVHNCQCYAQVWPRLHSSQQLLLLVPSFSSHLILISHILMTWARISSQWSWRHDTRWWVIW